MSTKVTKPKLFIGIDIHKRDWKMHAVTDICMAKSFTCPAHSHALQPWVEKNYKDHEVHCAYEAGCCGYEHHRDFIEYGWGSIVFNPADISRKGSTAFHKADQIDARLISQELKDGRLGCVHIPDRKREELRVLFRHRVALVRGFRGIKSQLKMQLLYLGIYNDGLN